VEERKEEGEIEMKSECEDKKRRREEEEEEEEEGVNGRQMSF